METMRPHCQTPEATAKSSEANWAFSQTFSLAQWQNWSFPTTNSSCSQMFTDVQHQTAQNSKASKCPAFDPKLAVSQNLVALPWKHPITSNNNHYSWKNNGSSSPIHMVMMEMDESIMNPWAFARNMDRSCTKSLNKSPASSSHLLTSGAAGLSHASRSSAICPGSLGIHQSWK